MAEETEAQTRGTVYTGSHIPCQVQKQASDVSASFHKPPSHYAEMICSAISAVFLQMYIAAKVWVFLGRRAIPY